MLTCAPGGPRALPSQVGAGSRKQFLVDKVYLWAFLASFSSHTSHCCPSLPLAISDAACHLASPRALAMHMGAAHFCGLSLPPAAPLPCSLHKAGVDQGSPHLHCRRPGSASALQPRRCPWQLLLWALDTQNHRQNRKRQGACVQ